MLVCHGNKGADEKEKREYYCHSIISPDIYNVATAISISGLGDHIATSGCRSLSQSFGDTFFEVATVENPIFAVGISTLSIIVPEI